MKKKIRIVMLLMVLALVGTLAFQAYWLASSYRVAEEQFEEKVSTALEIATQKIAGQTMISIIKSNGDETVIVRPQLFETSKFSIDTLRGSEINYTAKSIFFSSDSESKASYIKLFTGNTDNKKSIEALLPKIEKIADDKLDGISSFSITIDNTTVDSLHFARIIEESEKELSNEGIEGNFDFMLYSSEDKLLMSTDSIANDNNGLEAVYSAQLLPPYDKYSIRVSLQDKASIIFSKMKLTILASLLLAALNILCLAYALSTILNQKKVSDIKNDFINNMTHEFKTPISTISLATEALLKFNVREDAEKTDQYLKISQNEANRLGMMVEKVLKIAANDKKEVELNKQLVDLASLVNNTVQNSSVAIKQQGGQLSVDIPEQAVFVHVDEVHFSNVVQNLVDNALKYSSEKPEIKVALQSFGKEVRLLVEDKGIGVSKKHLPHIFDKFYRVPTGNLHNVKGFGLGLSYVKMVVNQHGGSIKVDSDLGYGTSFWISLPIAE